MSLAGKPVSIVFGFENHAITFILIIVGLYLIYKIYMLHEK